MAGVFAAEMAELGLYGDGKLIEPGPPGLFHAMLGQTLNLGALGKSWRLPENNYKRYPSCGFTHAAIEVGQQLAHDTDPSTIRGIRISANPVALQVAGFRAPATSTEARFSLPYAVTLGLLDRNVTPEKFGEKHLQRPDVRALLGMTELVADATIERWSSRVELTLADGEPRASTVVVPKGMKEQQLDWQDLEDKFEGAVFGRPGARALRVAIRRFGDEHNTELIRSLLRLQNLSTARSR